MQFESPKCSVSVEELAALYRAGHSVAKVGALTGLKVGRVYKMLVAAGVKMRGRNERPLGARSRMRISQQEVAAHYSAGESVGQVAVRAGSTSATVTRVLRELGVALRKSRRSRPSGLSDDNIARRYDAGETASVLSAEAGIGVAEVRQLLIARGVKLRPPLGSRRLRAEELRYTPEEIVELYLHDRTLQELAQELGVSRDRVQTILLKRGVKIRGRNGEPSQVPTEMRIPPERLAELYRAGQSIKQLAAPAGVSPGLVRVALLKLGVRLRNNAGKRGDDFRPLPVAPEKIAELYQAGKGIEPLAIQIGIGRKKLRRVLRQQQVRTRGKAEALRKDPPSPECTPAKIAQRYRAGATLEELARWSGSTPAVLRRILTECGVKLRPKTVSVSLPDSAIAALYQRGDSLDKIAALAGCGRWVVHGILVAQGVRIRGPRELATQPLLTPEEIEARYLAGSSFITLSAAAQMSTSWIASILRARGVTIRRRGGVARGETDGIAIPAAKMVELYLAGTSLRKIASLAGANPSWVARLLRQRGVRIRGNTETRLARK